MKRPTLIILAVLSLFFVLAASPVSAHVLKTDGSIGAILHINPDDSPISNQPTSYILYFGDTTNQFMLGHCNCKITISANGQTIATKPLVNTSELESDNIFTFPKSAVYSLAVYGQPKPGYKFQPFTLKYLVRVEGSGTSTQPFPPLLWLGLGMMMAIVLLGAYASEYA